MILLEILQLLLLVLQVAFVVFELRIDLFELRLGLFQPFLGFLQLTGHLLLLFLRLRHIERQSRDSFALCHELLRVFRENLVLPLHLVEVDLLLGKFYFERGHFVQCEIFRVV